MNYLLSLLIPTLPSRGCTTYPKLLDILLPQVSLRNDVELLSLLDNKSNIIGEKRNKLLGISKGRYFAFIDDDDRVSSDYVKSIVETIIQHPGVDLVLFDSLYTKAGKPPRTTYFGLEIPKIKHYCDRMESPPCHINVWRKDLVVHVQFPEIGFGEDRIWQTEVCKLAKTFARIPKTLYFYDDNPLTSETQGHK